MTGDKLPADEAQRIGLIWKCVADDAFAAEVEATAARMAAMPTAALVATRSVIDASMRLDYAAALWPSIGSDPAIGHRSCRS